MYIVMTKNAHSNKEFSFTTFDKAKETANKMRKTRKSPLVVLGYQGEEDRLCYLGVLQTPTMVKANIYREVYNTDGDKLSDSKYVFYK